MNVFLSLDGGAVYNSGCFLRKMFDSYVPLQPNVYIGKCLSNLVKHFYIYDSISALSIAIEQHREQIKQNTSLFTVNWKLSVNSTKAYQAMITWLIGSIYSAKSKRVLNKIGRITLTSWIVPQKATTTRKRENKLLGVV